MRRATIMGACFPPVTPAMCSLSRTLGKRKSPSDHHTPATATALLRAEVAVNFKKSQQISGEISSVFRERGLLVIGYDEAQVGPEMNSFCPCSLVGFVSIHGARWTTGSFGNIRSVGRRRP